MGQPTTDELRKLLLRRLAPAEVARLEAAIFEEDGVAERLIEEEFDLVDEYVRGGLTPADRADVERWLSATPEHMESLRVARGLAAVRRSAAPADAAPVTGRAYWNRRRGVFVAVLLAAASLAAVAVIPHWWWGAHFGQSNATPTSARSSAPAAGPLVPSPETGVPAQMSETGPAQIVMLLADADRGRSTPVVHVAAGAAALRLQAEVPRPPRDAAYSIRVDDDGGHTVFEGSHLVPRVAGRYRFVEVTVPVQVLGTGSRTISLRVEGTAQGGAPEYRWEINIEHRSR
jgi:hypothetical protein